MLAGGRSGYKRVRWAAHTRRMTVGAINVEPVQGPYGQLANGLLGTRGVEASMPSSCRSAASVSSRFFKPSPIVCSPTQSTCHSHRRHLLMVRNCSGARPPAQAVAQARLLHDAARNETCFFWEKMNAIWPRSSLLLGSLFYLFFIFFIF